MNASGDCNSTQAVSISGTRVPLGHILCNSRWTGSELVIALRGRTANIAFDDSLGVIDFWPSNNVAVIYISEADLLSGNGYRRKIVKLRKCNEVQGIIIGERTELSLQYFPALQKFVVLELGMTLIPVKQQSEAAGFMCQMMEVELHPYKNELRIKLKPSSTDESLVATLQLIPRLGETKVKALLERFPSLFQLCRAPKEELTAIIGAAAANSLVSFFTQPPDR